MTLRPVIALVLIATLAAGLWLLPVSAKDKEKEDDDAPARKIADEIVAKLKENDITAVFKVVKTNWISPVNELDLTGEGLKRNREAMTPRWGKPLGEVDFIRREVVGRSLVRYLYIEKFERFPMVWILTFYRVGDRWFSYGVSSNDDLGVLMLFSPSISK